MPPRENQVFHDQDNDSEVFAYDDEEFDREIQEEDFCSDEHEIDTEEEADDVDVLSEDEEQSGDELELRNDWLKGLPFIRRKVN